MYINIVFSLGTFTSQLCLCMFCVYRHRPLERSQHPVSERVSDALKSKKNEGRAECEAALDSDAKAAPVDERVLNASIASPPTLQRALAPRTTPSLNGSEADDECGNDCDSEDESLLTPEDDCSNGHGADRRKALPYSYTVRIYYSNSLFCLNSNGTIRNVQSADSKTRKYLVV